MRRWCFPIQEYIGQQKLGGQLSNNFTIHYSESVGKIGPVDSENEWRIG